MTISIIRTVGAISLVAGSTAAVPMCKSDSSASESTPAAANTIVATPAKSAGPGLPSDFPLAPGLSACRPVVTGPEVICDWHNVDGHAIYTFYHEALPKAGYTLRQGAGEVFAPHYLGLMAFEKGKLKGAVTIPGTDLTIQVVTVQ